MESGTVAPPGLDPERAPTGYAWVISLIAALAGLLFGYDFVVIGGAKPFFERYFQLHTDMLSGWANSCALLGCLIGALGGGGLSDRFGRKKMLIAAALLFAVSSVLTGWAGTFAWFVVWRISGGVAIGVTSNVAPVYIAEIAPASLRGRFVSVYQLTIFIGIAGAQFINWRIAEKMPAWVEQMAAPAREAFLLQSWNVLYGWRWMFTAVAAPSAVFFLMALLLPESPRWLVKNGMARRALNVLRSTLGEARAETALQDIRQTISAEEIRHVRLADLLEPKMRKILLLGVFLAVLQQWSGLNVIFQYAEEVYGRAGYQLNDILFNIVVTGTTCLVVNCIAIGTVDRFGRRVLMLTGCAGIAVCHALLGLGYLLGLPGIFILILSLAAMGFYGMSLAPVAWVLISEIFPNRIRGAAVAVAAGSLWIACFVLIFTFPYLKDLLTISGAVWLYGAICLVGFAVVFRYVPETKGKTLEQIERELAD
jgi:MFS transporter, SP family, xylose:H+ symportor